VLAKLSLQQVGRSAANPVQQRRFIAIGVAILMLCGLWLLAQWIWLFATPSTPPVPVTSASFERDGGPQLNRVNLPSLTALHLFGESAQEYGGQNAAANAPKTQLNLRLVGVSASSDPARSAAIIEQGNNQATYIIGDSLQNARVKIAEIYADRVILDNGGRLETLELEGIGELSDGLSLTLASSMAQDAAENSEPTPSETRNLDMRDNEALSAQLAEVAAQPSNLFSYIQVSPVTADGELKGYRLTPGAQPELFRAAGFQAGDLAVAINGYELTDVGSAMAATEELRTSSDVTITVIRDEEYIELAFSLPASQE